MLLITNEHITVGLREDGRDADNIVYESTLSNDRLSGKTFDYLIANPPYGKDWKRDPKDGQVGVVGYEINFNRYFYRYTPPRPLEEIEADILEMLRLVAGSV